MSLAGEALSRVFSFGRGLIYTGVITAAVVGIGARCGVFDSLQDAAPPPASVAIASTMAPLPTPTPLPIATPTATPRPTLIPWPTVTPTPTPVVSAVVWKLSDHPEELLAVGGGQDPPVQTPTPTATATPTATPIATETPAVIPESAGTVIVLCLGIGPEGNQNQVYSFPGDLSLAEIVLPCGSGNAVFRQVPATPKG